jgi:predicted aspartyl protease
MIGAVATTLAIAGAQQAAAGARRGSPAPPGPIALPVERASNVFFVKATVNGVGPMWFTVDTGATLTVIDPAVATRIGKTPLSIGARANVGVATDHTELATVSNIRIEIAGVPAFVAPTLYVVPVRGNAQALGHQIDGVIGTDFLQRYLVEFNYAAGTLSLTPPPFAGKPSEPGLPITTDGNVLLAKASVGLVDGDVLTARLLVDTGSGGGLTLTSPFVRQHRLIERFYTPTSRGDATSGRSSLTIGINGVMTAPVIVLGSLGIGSATWSSPRSSLSREAGGLTASTQFDGLLGAELLRRFTLTIDYPGKMIWLRQAK